MLELHLPVDVVTTVRVYIVVQLRLCRILPWQTLRTVFRGL